MRVKSLAVGMILPLAASVALATAPTASAATTTKAAVTQSGLRADRNWGDRGNRGYDRGNWGYDRGNWGYGHRSLSCYNPYLGWHRHYRWDRLHRWDRCVWRYDGGHRDGGYGGYGGY